MSAEIEILYEDGCGWYGYKDWGLVGEFLFKKYQRHWGEPASYNQWVRPCPFYTNKIIEYFDSKAEVEEIINNN